MNRREFVVRGGLIASAIALPGKLLALTGQSTSDPQSVAPVPFALSETRGCTGQTLPPGTPAPCCPLPPAIKLPPQKPPVPVRYTRPAEDKRRFSSTAVERQISEVRGRIPNAELAWMFENCYPNTLDTTVTFSNDGGEEDTFIITGDIPAMWLRDSTAQTTVYLPSAKSDAKLQAMFRGLIRRQARCILLDPYANAFYADGHSGEFCHDVTQMKPGIHERKWEIDSLCYPIRLAYLYWKATADRTPFDDRWHQAANLIVETFHVQQRLDSKPSPYHFARKADWFWDNSPNMGAGNPTRKVGLIHSAFRPSDDCCFFPFLIPSNMFAEVSLRQLAVLAEEVLGDNDLKTRSLSMANQLREALRAYAPAHHPVHGKIYAFEVDAYGNALFIDDANIPSLLSLPYLGWCSPKDATYQRTRNFVLGDSNPFFHKGSLAEGVGGPHVAPNKIWPLSIIMRALTTPHDSEVVACLRMLLATHAGTGLMHESFDPDKPQDFSRPWFAWCNSLFGELIVTLADNKPALLRAV